MRQRPLKVLLDCNVYDEFERDPCAADLLNANIAAGKIEVLMPDLVRRELARRSAGLPAWLQTTCIPDGVAVACKAIAGAARAGGETLTTRTAGSRGSGRTTRSSSKPLRLMLMSLSPKITTAGSVPLHTFVPSVCVTRNSSANCGHYEPVPQVLRPEAKG